jgi:CRP-like cAMP-binding protein
MCVRKHMANALIGKLQSFTPLNEEDCRALEQASAHPYHVGARQDLIRENEPPRGVFLIVDGFACRYKVVPGSGRQIMAYLLPGDCDDVDVMGLDVMDHSIATISSCQVVLMSFKTVTSLMRRPNIARALRLCTLVDDATLREWLANIGRRSADQRLAHLFMELLLRMQAVGLAADGAFKFPLTQQEIGDTMALSSVHVNRTLQLLRQAGLIVVKNKKMRVLDYVGLMRYSDFKPNYLHLLFRNNQKISDLARMGGVEVS